MDAPAQFRPFRAGKVDGAIVHHGQPAVGVAHDLAHQDLRPQRRGVIQNRREALRLAPQQVLDEVVPAVDMVRPRRAGAALQIGITVWHTRWGAVGRRRRAGAPRGVWQPDSAPAHEHAEGQPDQDDEAKGRAWCLLVHARRVPQTLA